jgi:cellulose synthase/poly-beta-1,6-N-acetylglucosamine synthase-like glycosyltransferase
MLQRLKAQSFTIGALVSTSALYYAVLTRDQAKTASAVAHNAMGTGSPPTEPPSLIAGYILICTIFLIGFIRAIRVHIRSRLIARGFATTSCRPKSMQDTNERTMRFTILIPARDEARVIRNTMTKLTELNYPRANYDVVVVTDQRETGVTGSTTRDIATEHAQALNRCQKHEIFTVIEVPDSFNGNLRDTGPPSIKSTKGRALNFALEWLASTGRIQDCSFLGVLDADGRLHSEALQNASEVAREEGANIIQGPVFQISNIHRADLIGVMAGIELSLHHISRMWRDLKCKQDSPRFLAGTNYFISPRLLEEVGGWNSESLVEDAELGLHLYIKRNARAAWLPAYEIEQTPPNWWIYLRQRERWALGHLQLLPIVSRSDLRIGNKIRVYFRVLRHFVESPLDILLPIASWYLVRNIELYRSGQIAQAAMALVTIASIYTWSYLSRGLLLLNSFSSTPMNKAELAATSALLTFCMPGLALLQLVPRLTALAKFIGNGKSTEWYKTERSLESTYILERHA